MSIWLHECYMYGLREKSAHMTMSHIYSHNDALSFVTGLPCIKATMWTIGRPAIRAAPCESKTLANIDI